MFFTRHSDSCCNWRQQEPPNNHAGAKKAETVLRNSKDRRSQTPTRKLGLPKIVTRAEWILARNDLLAKEKELTRALDTLAAQRRRLPMVRIEKDYVFEGPHQRASLL